MVKELYKAKNINPTNIDKLDLKTLKNLYVDNIEEFEYYEQIDSVIQPSKDSIKFDGNIYLLVYGAVYYSAEMLAEFVKSSEIATIIGEQTKGAGIGADPFIVMLPNSGLVMRCLVTMEDVTVNEKHPAMSDYVIKPAYTAIKKVLELEVFLELSK